MEETELKKVVFFTKIDKKTALQLKKNAEEYQKLCCKSNDSILRDSLCELIHKLDAISSSHYHFMIFCSTVNQIHYHVLRFGIWLECPTFYTNIELKSDGIIKDNKNQEYYDLKNGPLIQSFICNGNSVKFLLEQVSKGLLPELLKNKPNNKENENRLQEQETVRREGYTGCVLYGGKDVPRCAIGHLRNKERIEIKAVGVRVPQAHISSRCPKVLRT